MNYGERVLHKKRLFELYNWEKLGVPVWSFVISYEELLRAGVGEAVLENDVINDYVAQIEALVAEAVLRGR